MQPPTPTSPTSSDENAHNEQRLSTRNPYAYCQMIAPMFGGRLPSELEFFEVECDDLCTGGLAFFLDGRPHFKTLIVRLGVSPAFKHVRARVLNVTDVDRGGTPGYRVGCRFVDQIVL